MTGLELKIARLRLGLKQYKVAQKSRLHPSTYNLIENEKRQARPAELAAILRALGLKPEVGYEADH